MKPATLAAAEEGLEKIRPKINRAMRWGMFDGFKGRPSSTAGLAMEPVPQNIEGDYRHGREIGRELSLREVPA